MKAIIKYIVFDFKNVVNNDYKNRTTFISLKLRNVELKRKDKRLIENVLKIVFSKSEYISNLNICSTLLFDKKIITSLRKSLMNVFNIFTSFPRIARFILLGFVQSVICFLNLSSQFVSKIIEKQIKKVLHEKLKSFLAKKKILLSRKIVVDDQSRIIVKTFQLKQSFKTFSLLFFFFIFCCDKIAR